MNDWKVVMPYEFSSVIPLLLQVAKAGVSKDLLARCAATHGWTIYNEDKTSVTYELNNSFILFVTEGDSQCHDHVCVVRWVPEAPLNVRPGELEGAWNRLFAVAYEALRALLGEPEREGPWPKTPYDCYADPYRYALWRSGKGIVVVQQDDIDPQSGPDVNICIQNWEDAHALPAERRWRYKHGKPPSATQALSGQAADRHLAHGNNGKSSVKS
jgi:hypothetical protein